MSQPAAPSAPAPDSASELALAIELGHIAVWRVDLVQERVYPNAQAWEVLGLPPSEAGISVDELRALTHPDDVARMRADTQATLAGEQPSMIEARYRRPDGSWRHVLMRRAVQRDSSGRPVALIGVGMDVTERIEQRQRADEMARRFELVTRTAGIGYWLIEQNAERAVWSDELRALFGLPQTAPVPTVAEWLERYVHPGDRDELRRGFANWGAAGDESKALAFRALRPDGSVRHLLAHSRVETGNHPPLMFGVIVDLTERRNAEQALRGAAERVALATRGAGLGTWELDLDTGQADWDAQMWLLRGLEPQPRAMTHAERMACVHPDDRSRMDTVYTTREGRQAPQEHEFRIVRPDGQVRWLATRSIAVTDEASGTRRRIGVNWDVTDTRNAQAARRESELAQRESLAKSKFLARMSHELRTPLNAVLGFSQLLLAEDQGSDAAAASRRRRLDHIRSAGQHLLTLINDVLDLSSLEGGELRIVMQPVALAPVVQQALAMLGPLIETGTTAGRPAHLPDDHGISVQTGNLDCSVMADPTRLCQVLVNLLSNAVKYNRDGGSVRIEALPHGEQVRVRVADDGRGMSAEQLQHLFEPFNRLGVQREGSGAIEGTGIGLAIVKALLHHMGGSVHVESTPGVGSVFELRLIAAQPTHGQSALPAAGTSAQTSADSIGAPADRFATAPPIAAAPAAPAAPAPPAPRRRVLYIEDNPINALIITELMERRSDLALQVAVDGASGIAQAATLRPDLILLDMQLPDFDGFEVLRRLRAQAATSTTPVIALSANAMPDDIQRALSAGMADYWTKPLDFKQFLTALEAFFGPRAP